MPDRADELTCDLLSKLLVKEPSKRLGANSIHELKAHPFFASVNFDTIYSTSVQAPLSRKLRRLSKQ